MFRSRNEWFAHELQCHRREWVCQYCQHKAFNSASTYSKHLNSLHTAILGKFQLEALLLQSEEPVDKIASNACPLCDEWEASLKNSKQDAKRLLLNDGRVVEPYGTPKQFRRHLGRHMEQLALFALPTREGDGLEDDSSEDDEFEEKSEDPQSNEPSINKEGSQVNLIEDDGEMQGDTMALFDVRPEQKNELPLVESQGNVRRGSESSSVSKVENVKSNPGGHDILADLSALQREIDALRNQSGDQDSKISSGRTDHLDAQNEQVSDSRIQAQLSVSFI